MNDLADDERKLLDDMRRVLTPMRSDRDRLAARIAASIALGTPSPLPDDGPDASRPSEGAGSFAQGIRGIGAQALAATLVAATAFGAGYFTGRSRPSSATIVAPPTRADDVRPTVRVAAVENPVRAVEAPPLQPPTPKAVATPSSAPAAVPSAHTLSEEALELQRVDRALRSGMPRLALGILHDLDERIPRGVLLEERAAARLMARCQNGDAEAPSAVATWLERHEQSVYAPRLRAACTEKRAPE
jgi:hypothetical protein